MFNYIDKNRLDKNRRGAAREPRRSMRPGFTIAELLITLFIASVGMIAVFGMQIAAQQVQRQGRDLNAARTLADVFYTRLRAEADFWTNPNWMTTDPSEAYATSDMPLLWWGRWGAAAAGTWVAVPNAAGTDGVRYSSYGIPNDSADTRVVNGRAANAYNQRYCIHYNVEPVGTAATGGDLARVQIRVFWPLRDDAFAQLTSTCASVNPAELVTAMQLGYFRYYQGTNVLSRKNI